MSILIKPIITEKMSAQADSHNRFGFVVDPRANKLEIKTEIEKVYGVTVESVNTMNYQGKSRRRYTRRGLVDGKKNDFKKAVVTLAEGDTIDFYTNV